MTRKEFVHEPFIRMWARRYLEVYTKEGELSARIWFKQFVHDEDKAQVMAAIREGSKK